MPAKSFMGILALVIALCACGGGGGDSNNDGNNVPPGVNANADGLYNGTYTDNDQSFEVTGFVKNNRLTAVNYAGGVLLQGRLALAGNDFTSTLTFYGQSSGVRGTADANGSVVERESISGTFTASDSTSGTFSLRYDPIYERNATLRAISGIWSEVDVGFTTTLTIQNDGSFEGSDTDGCLYAGSIGVFDPDFNLYDVRFRVMNCGAVNGNYRGFTALHDTNNRNDTLAYAVYNANYIEIGQLLRQ